MTRAMKGKPEYIPGYRYNYGAVDYREGTHVMDTTLANLHPEKLAEDISAQLNVAVEKGFNWALQVIRECKQDLGKISDHDFEACIKKKGLM